MTDTMLIWACIFSAFILMVGGVDEQLQQPQQEAAHRNINTYHHSMRCNRLYPHTRGSAWSSDALPFYFPHGCRTQLFDEADTKKCMQNRTLYVIGNSVGRQAAFGIVEMLGGAQVKRENQRDLCPKHETFWGDSCHNEYEGVKIRYLFLQYLDGFNYTDRGGFPFMRDETLVTLPGSPNDLPRFKEDGFWDDDNCVNMPTRKCLQKFFSGSTANDVLIFTVGMPYCKDYKAGQTNDWSWLRSSASAFRGHIDATFPGVVFHQSGAQLLYQVAGVTPCMKEVDDILWEIMYPVEYDPINPNAQWYTIDQWDINRDRDPYYNDHVHYVGPLTNAMLSQVLNELCPGGGKDVAGTLGILSMHVISTSDSTKKYVVHQTGMFLQEMNPDNEYSCFNVWKVSSASPVVRLNDTEIQQYSQGRVSSLLDVCKERTLLRPASGRSVYLVEDGQVKLFNSGDAFIRRGFDFDDVKVIDDWYLSMFKRGEDLN